MTELSELKREQKRISGEIRKRKKADEEKRKNVVLTTQYAKVVCLGCYGRGEVTHGGADIISDPPEDLLCESCGGAGYKNRELWSGAREYKLEFDQGEGY